MTLKVLGYHIQSRTIFLAMNKCQILKHGAQAKRHGENSNYNAVLKYFLLPTENHW